MTISGGRIPPPGNAGGSTGRGVRRTVVAAVLALCVITSLSGLQAASAAGPGGYTWVGQNPLGTGQRLYANYTLSGTAAWAVGEYGTILFWNGTTLVKQNSGTTNNLYGVYARSTTRVWAVGEKGTILFFNGTTWAPQGTGVTTYDLVSITAPANNRAWAVGGYDGFTNAVILYYNGTTWTVQLTQATGGFTDVYSFSTTAVWAVGIWTWRYNGTTWAKVNDGDSGAGIDPYRVTGYSATNLWAVGWSGKVLNSTNAGVTWNEAPTVPDTGTPYGVYWPASINALNATTIYCVGWGGSIAMWNGAAWVVRNSGTTKDINDVEVFNATTITAAGDAVLIRYGAPIWLGMSGGTSSRLNAVHARNVDNVWTVGTNVATYGNIQRTTDGGSTWTTQAGSSTNTLNAVDYFDATHVWTGGQTYLDFYNGAAWSRQIDGTGNTITSTVAVGTQPRSAAVNTNTNKIYVANASTNNVTVIDGGTDTVSSTIAVGNNPRGVCVNPATNKVYVGNNAAASVTVINGLTDTVIGTVGVGTQPYRLNANPVTNKIYVANYGTDNVSVIDGATDTVATTVAVGDGPISAGVNSATNKIYAGNYIAGTVSIIDGVTDTVFKTVAVGSGPYDVGANPVTNKMYIPNDGSANISVINGVTDTVSATIAVGTNPRGVGVNETTNRIYAANFTSNTVSVIDGSTDTVSTTIAAGTNPFDAGVIPSADKIYVANYGGNNVSVINGHDRTFNCLNAAAINRVWAGTDDPWIRYYNGSTWTMQNPDPLFGGAYYGVAAPDTTHVWAVGDAGEIVYWNGTSWAKQNSSTAVTLRAVTAVDASTAWAVGDGGTIRYTNDAGATWQTQVSGTGVDLLGVSAADATHVWAVGMGGTIVYYDGVNWTAQQSPTTENLRAVHAYDANDAWAVGDNGTIIFADPPYIKSCAPGWGRPGDAVDVEVIGAYTHFTWPVTLDFGAGVSVVPGSVSVWDNTHVYARVQVDPGATLGPRDVNVTSVGETPIPLANGFVVGDPPTITSVTPASGARGETLDVEISAERTNFAGGDSVAAFSADGITVNSTNVIDPTHATANITISGETPLEPGDVNVITGTEAPAPLAQGFTVTESAPAAPVITSITPDSGPPGAAVTIDGANFGAGGGAGAGDAGTAGSRVSFNGVTANSYPEWSDTRIQAVVPEGATRGPVTVVTPVGTSNADKVFTPTTSPTWYLAEGSTAWGFDTDVAITNPNATPVTVRVTYLTNGGPVARPDIYLPAMSRANLRPAEDGLASMDFSTKLECMQGVPIGADRTMYWKGQGAQASEGHSSVGVAVPSKSWYMAEGSSAWGFECWLLLMNPNQAPANCVVTYMLDGGATVTAAKTVPANSRASFNIADDIGTADASVMVSSDSPVIAERSMYRNSKREGHDSVGVAEPAQDFFLAEGSTAWGFTTYVLVQNPNPAPAQVTLTYMTPGGPSVQPVLELPANSRRTVRVNDAVTGTDVSTFVHGSLPIVAERSMYWDSGRGEACHDSIGTTATRMTWNLAGGQCGTGYGRSYETWTLVQNPNGAPVDISITYLTADGAKNKTLADTVPANSRRSYNMAGALTDQCAGVLVESRTPDTGIIVEQSMYWDGRGAGACTIAEH